MRAKGRRYVNINLLFKMDTIIMKDRQKQLYYLPNGALSFKEYFIKEKGNLNFKSWGRRRI